MVGSPPTPTPGTGSPRGGWCSAFSEDSCTLALGGPAWPSSLAGFLGASLAQTPHFQDAPRAEPGPAREAGPDPGLGLSQPPARSWGSALTPRP